MTKQSETFPSDPSSQYQCGECGSNSTKLVKRASRDHFIKEFSTMQEVECRDCGNRWFV